MTDSTRGSTADSSRDRARSVGPSPAPAAGDAFLSSGQSPGKTLHLVGPGQVGRAFLPLLDAGVGEDASTQLVAVSDRSGTVFHRDGLDGNALVAFKKRGGNLVEWDGAESIPTELAIRVVSADIVVDATPSLPQDGDAAVLRGRAGLQCGASLALCSKNALAQVAGDWLAVATRARVGVNAALGGTGAQLVRELEELRADSRALTLVGNVATTAIVAAVEQGASIEQGIAQAQRLGFLEPDATLDLNGSDAATKLLCVWSAVFADSICKAPSFASVRREDIRDLSVAQLRERAARGATTRLIARGSRAGGDLRVAYEEVAPGSPLAVPADRVVYGYELPSGLRVHTGLGVGYERTAQALLADVQSFCTEAQR